MMASGVLSYLQAAQTVSACLFKRVQLLGIRTQAATAAGALSINAASASNAYLLPLIRRGNSGCYSNAADRTGIDRDIGWFANPAALLAHRADRVRQANGQSGRWADFFRSLSIWPVMNGGMLNAHRASVWSADGRELPVGNPSRMGNPRDGSGGARSSVDIRMFVALDSFNPAKTTRIKTTFSFPTEFSDKN